jgi:hypothetical protein
VGTRVPEICQTLAEQLRTVVPLVSYPAPAAINTKQPHAVVFGGSGVPVTTPTAMGKLDEYLDLIRDLFSPHNRAAYFLEETGGVPRVDYCHFADYEVSGQIEYAGQPYYAGALNFLIKRHRFDGDE